MSEALRHSLELILEHILVCEKRFAGIDMPADFVKSEQGEVILDSLVTRLQAIGENLKRVVKHVDLQNRYPDINWQNIIRFRDFISHHYEKLDYEIIYDICKTDLPLLKAAILDELG
jgi:uncharacterized protein with HEPN domain